VDEKRVCIFCARHQWSYRTILPCRKLHVKWLSFFRVEGLGVGDQLSVDSGRSAFLSPVLAELRILRATALYAARAEHYVA